METLYHVGLSNAVIATVLALGVACLRPVLARRPAVLHCLWLLVLVKLVTPPIYMVAIPWPKSWDRADETRPASDSEIVHGEREQEPVELIDRDLVLHLLAGSSSVPSEPASVPQLTATVATRPLIDWTRVACLLWVAGTVTTLTVALIRIRRFQRLLGEAQPAADETQQSVDALAARLGLDRAPSVWWVAGRLSPLVWPVGWRPRLILPTELWKGLDHHQRTTLIVHELAHLRRGDHQLRLFELLVTALYWWHPVVWWARHALRDAEEQCCDAWVVWAFPDTARSYADTLLETLDFLSPSDLAEPFLASGLGKVRHLRRRLTMIMSGTTPRFLGTWGTLGSLGLAVALLPVHATWAQKSEEKKEVRIIVNADGDRRASATSVSTAEGGKSEASTVMAVEDGKSGRVIVKYGDSTPEVLGSRAEVIKKLKNELAEIEKKSPQTHQDEVRRQVIQRVIRMLFDMGTNLPRGKSAKARIVTSMELDAKTDDGKDVGAKTTAEIDKARAEVEELSRAVQSKQKELTAAHMRLSKLMAARQVHAYVVNPVPVGEGARLKELQFKSRQGPHAADANQKRIEELEKKLEKLLEEVAALKKDRKK